MKIYIGADHRGFELKNTILSYLERDYAVVDMGANTLDPGDDYTLYAEKVASIVSGEKEALGILICGSGVGVNIVANKFDGVRAGMGISPKQTKFAKLHDDINILILASDFISTMKAKQIVDAFLKTKFDHKERHSRRISEIGKIEANN